MAGGTIDDVRFQAPLEPDGKGGHWLKLDKPMLKAIQADAGDTVTLAIKPVKEWPEPDVPADLKDALAAVPQARSIWVRWIGATKQAETRKRRIEVALSKLEAGDRRPCCFNRNACTEPDVSKNGVLLEPVQTTVAKAK
jgi:hypothetical protein